MNFTKTFSYNEFYVDIFFIKVGDFMKNVYELDIIFKDIFCKLFHWIKKCENFMHIEPG